jgi:hypothetical protein
MRFNEILHPEILLGLRGQELERVLYRAIMPHTKIVDEELFYNQDIEIVKNHFDEGEYLYSNVVHLYLCHKFKTSNKKIYRLGSELATTFKNIRGHIPVGLIPIKTICYISLPKNLIATDDGTYLTGAYIYIGNSEKVLSRKLYQKNGDDVLLCSFISASIEPEYIQLVGPILSLNLSTKPYKNQSSQWHNDALNVIVNTLIYVNSSEPHIELAPPIHTSRKSKKELARQNKIINETLLPVDFVYKNFHCMKYIVDGCQVAGHMRWQRCGENWSKVKLIWIDPHERKYNKLCQLHLPKGRSLKETKALLTRTLTERRKDCL